MLMVQMLASGPVNSSGCETEVRQPAPMQAPNAALRWLAAPGNGMVDP